MGIQEQFLGEIQEYVEGSRLDLDPLDPAQPYEVFSVLARTESEQVQYYLFVYPMISRWQQDVFLVIPFQITPFRGTPKIPIILPHVLFEEVVPNSERAAGRWADLNGCDPDTVAKLFVLDLH